MAARKVNRAPLPPPLQQPQQQPQTPRYQTEERVGTINFCAESGSDGGSEVAGSAAATKAEDAREHRLTQDAEPSAGRYRHSSTVSDLQTQPPEYQEQRQEMQPSTLKRISYIPNKSVAPPPPQQPIPQSPSQSQPSEQARDIPGNAQTFQPSSQQPQPSPSKSADRPPTVVYQTVYTRPRNMDRTDFPATVSRLTNPFAPTPRPLSQPLPFAGSSKNLLAASKKSSGSQKSLRNLAGEGHSNGMTLKGRLSSLFRRKSRKPLPGQQQPQQPERARHQSVGATVPAAPQSPVHAQPLASRKNLHTFTFTDAKIYNPNNAQVYIGSVPSAATGAVSAKSKGPAPPPPSTVPTAASTVSAAEINDEAAGRNQVWWNMRTMGATRSSYSTDVLLVRNPDPAPDYETSTTRF